MLKPAGAKEDCAFAGALIHADLDLDPEYSGTKTAPTKITFNGYEVEVTENLAQALQHLRRESESIYIWADALCINRQDVNEKNHQVVLTEDIYAYAGEVVVWLGPDEEGHAAELFAEANEIVILLERSIDSSIISTPGPLPSWINCLVYFNGNTSIEHGSSKR